MMTALHDGGTFFRCRSFDDHSGLQAQRNPTAARRLAGNLLADDGAVRSRGGNNGSSCLRQVRKIAAQYDIDENIAALVGDRRNVMFISFRAKWC